MATKEQFEAFKYLFQWEEDRAKSLGESGKTYLTLITLFFAYLGYKLSDAEFGTFLKYHFWGLPLALGLYGTMGALLLLGLLLTIWSLFMRGYERIMDAQTFFLDIVAHGRSDQDFFDLFITEMNVATENNSHINNSRAYALLAAASCLFLGFVFYGIVFGISAWCKVHVCPGATP